MVETSIVASIESKRLGFGGRLMSDKRVTLPVSSQARFCGASVLGVAYVLFMNND
jgi:hypothetical protein